MSECFLYAQHCVMCFIHISHEMLTKSPWAATNIIILNLQVRLGDVSRLHSWVVVESGLNLKALAHTPHSYALTCLEARHKKGVIYLGVSIRKSKGWVEANAELPFGENASILMCIKIWNH